MIGGLNPILELLHALGIEVNRSRAGFEVVLTCEPNELPLLVVKDSFNVKREFLLMLDMDQIRTIDTIMGFPPGSGVLATTIRYRSDEVATVKMERILTDATHSALVALAGAWAPGTVKELK